LDISDQMLRFAPTGVRTRVGSMTDLPFESDFFDGAYATESLEHAVEIERAVSEICPRCKALGAHHSDRQKFRALGQIENAGMGTVVHPQGTRAFAGPSLPAGF
jgi:ubiquinone/menaquinone biosynthesis C-methylase UbiE